MIAGKKRKEDEPMASELERKEDMIDSYMNLLRIQAAGNDGWAAEVDTQLTVLRVKLEAAGVVVDKIQVFR